MAKSENGKKPVHKEQKEFKPKAAVEGKLNSDFKRGANKSKPGTSGTGPKNRE
jgi:hypothetical protein